MHHFGKIDGFYKNEIADYSGRLNVKLIFKKINNTCEIQETKCSNMYKNIHLQIKCCVCI